MKNLNFWSKFFMLNFWSSWYSRLLRPCTKWRGQKKINVIPSMLCNNWKKIFAKNSLNVTSVKLLSNIFFNDFGCFLMLSCFQPLIESKNVCFWLVVTFYYSKKTTKTQKNSKCIKEQKVFPNWTIEGAQHQKNKNWWIWHKSASLRNT